MEFIPSIELSAQNSGLLLIIGFRIQFGDSMLCGWAWRAVFVGAV